MLGPVQGCDGVFEWLVFEAPGLGHDVLHVGEQMAWELGEVLLPEIHLQGRYQRDGSEGVILHGGQFHDS